MFALLIKVSFSSHRIYEARSEVGYVFVEQTGPSSECGRLHSPLHSRSPLSQLLKAFTGCNKMSQPSLSCCRPFRHSDYQARKKQNKQINKQNQEHGPHGLTCGEGYSKHTELVRFSGSNWSGLHRHCESNGGENESVI